MPRELITIQVGQCGNQVGVRFWDLALREHAAANPRAVFDEPLSSFFRNVDSRYDDPLELPLGAGATPIRTLKARAVLVDMEEGVISQLERGPLADLFDARQRVTSHAGAGNNWAHGHAVDGPRHADELLEVVRRAAEFCDSLQCFSLVHSLGGGTGSGVGTFLLPLLADHFPGTFRFVTCLLPGADDDVITSPYNTLLALDQLIDHADCVLPADNGALAHICARARGGGRGSAGAAAAGADRTAGADGLSTVANGGQPGAKLRAFDEANNVVGALLSNLTAGMRFEGSVNVDLNEITTNLVPVGAVRLPSPRLPPPTPRAPARRWPRASWHAPRGAHRRARHVRVHGVPPGVARVRRSHPGAPHRQRAVPLPLPALPVVPTHCPATPPRPRAVPPPSFPPSSDGALLRAAHCAFVRLEH